MQPPFLHDTIAGPSTFLTDGDGSFLTNITRLDPDGNKLAIEIEVFFDWDKIYEAGQVGAELKLACGLSIQADAMIVLTEAEQRDLMLHDQVTDWKRESISTDEDARQDAAERAREGRREAHSMGLIRSH